MYPDNALKPFLRRFLSLSLKFIEHLTGSTNVHVVEVSSTSGGQRPPSLPRKPTGSTRPDLISPSAPPFEGKFHSANNGSSTSVLPARDTSSSKADTRYRQIPLPVRGVWTYWGGNIFCVHTILLWKHARMIIPAFHFTAVEQGTRQAVLAG